MLESVTGDLTRKVALGDIALLAMSAASVD
jgi:hypothetical protein